MSYVMLLAGPIASPDCVSYLISVCYFAVSNTGHIAPWLWNMDSCNSQHHIVKEIDMLMIVDVPAWCGGSLQTSLWLRSGLFGELIFRAR